MSFIDPYTLEETELKVLESEPVSFLLLGKPKCGKSEVAKFLSAQWGAKLVSEIPLIENEQANGSELGEQIRGKHNRFTVACPSYVSIRALKDSRNP